MTSKPLIVLCCLTLLACKEETAALPDPLPLNAETIAHYCMMNIAEHPGPKAQIFLTGLPDPIFFAQVRDAFTYLASAEQDGYVSAIYVSDMTDVIWATPGAENWMAAEQAVYVVGSTQMGGMGVPELVPFSDKAAAENFALEFGGQLHAMQDVPTEAYLAPVALNTLSKDGS